jgi:hypothetical protein
MAAVLEVQARNAVDTIEVVDGAFVTCAAGAPLSGQPRWEEKLESLEFSLASFGIVGNRHGDDSVTVAGVTKQKKFPNTYWYGETPAGVVNKNTPDRVRAVLDAAVIRTLKDVCDSIPACNKITGDRVNFSKFDFISILDFLLDADVDEAYEDDIRRARKALLQTIWIKEL